MEAGGLGSPVIHDRSGHRFVTRRDGHEALLSYRRKGDLLTVIHTSVPEAIGGRGIAGELVRAVLDYARSQGWKVAPECSYTAAWLGRHPEYADLRE